LYRMALATYSHGGNRINNVKGSAGSLEQLSIATIGPKSIRMDPTDPYP
jgi:hypothetical protein